MVKRKKAFTLIELIAVLVIMAILALIVTPLVMSIIRKAKIAADKRSIDAYGRSIDLAIAGYLLDNGTFPISIEQLTIEYSGDEVVCSTTQMNSDSSVYLTGCTVGGRNVEDEYGNKEQISYKVGDEMTYNRISYYVLEDSDEMSDKVTLIKKEPIMSSEISSYLNTTEVGIRVDISEKYAKMYYYYGSECATSGHLSGCTTEYAASEIKQIVDVWVDNYVNPNDLVSDSMGYKSRLITKDEVISMCELDEYQATPSNTDIRCITKYDWIFNTDIIYWTMTPYGDSTYEVYAIKDYNIASLYNSRDNKGSIYSSKEGIRPVITISKSALEN